MPIRGPGVNNWNTSLFKNFRIKERFNFQFRVEAYNTFNHTQFSGVDTSHSVQRRGREYSDVVGDHHLGARPALPATGAAIYVLEFNSPRRRGENEVSSAPLCLLR